MLGLWFALKSSLSLFVFGFTTYRFLREYEVLEFGVSDSGFGERSGGSGIKKLSKRRLWSSEF